MREPSSLVGHTREVKLLAPTFYFSFQILKEKNKAAEMNSSFESIMYLAIKLNWQEIDIPATLHLLKKLSSPWWHTYREKHQKLKKNNKYKIFNQKQSTKQTDDYTQQFLVVTKRSEVNFSPKFLLEKIMVPRFDPKKGTEWPKVRRLPSFSFIQVGEHTQQSLLSQKQTHHQTH